MPEGEKPYRLYRGGRVKGRVPLPPRLQREGGPLRRDEADGKPERAPARPPRRRRFRPNVRSWRFWIRTVGTLFLAFVLLTLSWLVASYFAIRSGTQAANKRLPKSAKNVLADQNGMLMFHGTGLLFFGVDHSKAAQRTGNQHSDTIMYVRTDPDHHRLAYLSIPRDLWVEIPGHGFAKINAAYQIGGPALAARTIHGYTKLEINHLLIADFNDFRTLIDKLGGIDVTVPDRILSNEFDCPYSFERCQSWHGWRFAKGRQHMNGWRALIYSRIRENQLDPTESDLTRGERQQQVLQATMGKLTSVGTFTRLPWVGDDVLAPLTTDLSAGQFLQLGWVMKRANRSQTLHCRLGGTAAEREGQSIIEATEENFAVIHMVLGDSAPQPPLPGSGPYGPGCVVGSKRFDR